MKRIAAFCLVVMLLCLACAAGLAEEYQIADIADARVGNVITLGEYPQEGAEDQPIEWIVLQKANGAAFVISRYILEGIPYHENKDKVTWEECSLRAWLNGDFYYGAFSDEERALIMSTKTNEEYDYIFLMNRSQAIENYLHDGFAWRKGIPTQHALDTGLYNENGRCSWWLRTRGKTNNISWVFASGRDVSTHPDKGYKNINGVRPAMWILTGK
ncbi:MAG: hypothetical protein IJ157_05770 [Clostridia bacterium]|nr:hypothetical protein [Clostridia bacterium]